MKILALLTLAALLAGCAAPDPQTCATTTAAMEAYQLTLVARDEPSKEEIAAARTAAAFLAAYCGWARTRAVDRHGVPIVLPP